MSLAFTLVLSVVEPSVDELHDVLVRGTADQTVGELGRRLAGYLGRPVRDAAGEPLVYRVRVERTGEQLRPEAALSTVDLLEGDVVTLLTPRAGERRRPVWAVDDGRPGSGQVVRLRPGRGQPE